MVPGLEGEIEEFLGHHHLAVADQVEDRFHLMGKGGDLVEAEHGAGTLDGVHRPEDPADQVLVVRSLFQFEQGGLQFGEQFGRFFTIGGNMLFNHGIDPISTLEIRFLFLETNFQGTYTPLWVWTCEPAGSCVLAGCCRLFRLLSQYLLHYRDQLFGLEGFDDPAGGPGRLAFRLFGIL